jgi:hypothetical protein
MEGVARPLAETVLYLYGFVRASAPVPPLAGLEPGSRVFLVAAGDLACAASEVPAEIYRSEQRAPERGEWLTRRAIQHHEIIQALHAAGGVLPLKFGTLCQSHADVSALLDDVRPAIGQLLERFAGKDEWTLKSAVDTTAIASVIERESASVTALRERESALPEGRAYFVRKQRIRLMASLISERLAVLEDAVGDRLGRLGVPLLRMRRSPENPSNALTDAPLLVDRDALDAVKEALIDLQTEHAACGVSFTLVGPWPPYSFVPALSPGQLSRELIPDVAGTGSR